MATRHAGSANPDSSFWDSKKVMVTGGSGFLGSHLVGQLEALGTGEIVIPRSKDHDLRESDAVAGLLETTRPDIIFHLAAKVGGIGANQDNPADFFYENLQMGSHIIHQSHVHDVEKLVLIGTVCSYPKFTPTPFKEEDLWNGYPEETNAPYGLAKRALIVQSQAYHQQYGLKAINLIPVNLHGPNDNFDPKSSHVIPALMLKMLDAREAGASSISVWGDGSATREFLYVADAARGMILGAERHQDPSPVNLGTGSEISIRNLVELIAGIVGFAGEVVWDPTKPNGQPRRQLDTTRARESFGFVAETDLADGLRETFNWYLKETNRPTN